MTEDVKKPLGRILLKQRAVTQPELDRALAEPSGPGHAPLATRLIEAGAITEIAALKALSEQSGVPGIDLSQVCIRLSDLGIVPRELAQRHKLIPVLVREDRVFVAMAAPTEKRVIDEIEFVTGKRVFPYIALAGPLLRVIQAAYDMKDRGESHYVGPNCPADVRRRAGVLETSDEDEASFASLSPPTPAVPIPATPVRRDRPAEPVPAGRDAPDPFARGPELPRRDAPPAASPLVIDDALGRAAAADELTDADFGAADRELSVVAPLPREGAPGVTEGKRTMLVVDDEADIRKLLRRVFEERGFRVLEADRGNAALRQLKETVPDVLVLDAMLPEVHGFEIARRMKGTERYGHVPIVMVSAVYRGWRFAEDLKSSYGVEAYIEKPFKVSDVVAAVEQALAGRKDKPVASETLSAGAERLLTEGIAAYQRGDLSGAIEKLREGAHVDPLAYRLHFHLGLLYGKSGQIYDAIQALETALHINERHFPAIKNLAILYQKAGLRNKAIEMWERALTLAPDDPTRQSIREHLLSLL
ncbi:MAG TPA: response regulator [Minicystis sp.]|nr:response regulator [Minicystis sp.]